MQLDCRFVTSFHRLWSAFLQGLRRFVLIFGLAAASYWKGRREC